MTHSQGASLTGFVAIVGRPNVGKSTLLNALVGEKVSITSRKAHTTRQAVRGVLTRTIDGVSTQFIFVDTPGMDGRTPTELNRRMNQSVRAALSEVDVIVMVMDAKAWTKGDSAVLQCLPEPPHKARVLLAINKIDALKDKNSLLPLMAQAQGRYPFVALLPVSAEKSLYLDALLSEIAKGLPQGEPLFESDAYTDRSARFLAAELVREKAFRLLGDELPYGLAVSIERWLEDDACVHIDVTIWLERDSHRAMVIGAGGAKLREIGRLARMEIEQLLHKKVRLDTYVRVRRGWSDRAADLKMFGYE